MGLYLCGEMRREYGGANRMRKEGQKGRREMGGNRLKLLVL